MSANIGQNFSYLGKNFLDNRQGFPKLKDDLKNWSLPVPPGFEVCLGTTWYYYDPSERLPDTGHWIPRLTDDFSKGLPMQAVSRQALQVVLTEYNNKITELTRKLTQLEGTLFPVSFDKLTIGPAWITSKLSVFEEEKTKILEEANSSIGKSNERFDYDQDGTVTETDIDKLKEILAGWQKYDLPEGTGKVYSLDVGSSIIPRLTWRLKRKGKHAETVSVGGDITGEKFGKLSDDKESYLDLTTYSSNDLETKSYRVSLYVDDTNFVEDKLDIMFKYRTYFGTGIESFLKESYDEKTDLQEFSSFLTDDGELPRSNFDCTGGKYPYIMIPTTHYRADLRILVNDFLNSDFDVYDCTVTNRNGISIQYKILRTSTVQTGNPIPIQIKK